MSSETFDVYKQSVIGNANSFKKELALQHIRFDKKKFRFSTYITREI